LNLKYIGILNFKKLLTGSQQYHFLGTFKELSLFSWVVIVLLTLLVLYRLIKYFINDTLATIHYDFYELDLP